MPHLLRGGQVFQGEGCRPEGNRLIHSESDFGCVMLFAVLKLGPTVSQWLYK